VARIVRLAAPGVVELSETASLRPGPGEVRVRTLFSGISAGTEMAAYLGTSPYLHRRWDAEQRLFKTGDASLTYPIAGWGYQECGRIAEVGAAVSEEHVGELVWGLWGHRSDAVMPVEQALVQRLPNELDPRLGIFARVGAVALNAVIDADIHVGETVAVFGQGVIGLLATQLVALSGARVVAVDAQPTRLAMSTRLGATQIVLVPTNSPAELVRDWTGGRGADVCIEISGSYAALQEAVRTVCYSGRIVAAGFYQGDAEALRLGEEFHHNRVEIVGSQISSPASRYTNRWSKERLHHEYMRLIAERRITPTDLITHVLPAEQVGDAFVLLAEADPDVLQVVLDFQHS
jgi:2-desacetyl-2-hydroxyethyl bacteriochlorophyllide A dehydrogenase